MEMGLRNSADSATEFRNSCPPPSSMLPSITSEGTTDAIGKICERALSRVDGVTLAGVEIVVTSHLDPDPPLVLPFYCVTPRSHSSPRSTRY